MQPTREWVTANDFIYWLNGVNDRIFHNSTSHSAPLISIDLADVALDDDSEWAPFVDPVPGHVLVYLDKIQFMIGPWWNVTEPDGLVDPSTRAALLDLKKSMYGGLSSISALSVQTGNAEPIIQSAVEDTPPAVYWHWQIPNEELADFQAAVQVPNGLALAPVRLQDGDAAAAHWLTLTVQRVSGAESGLRAEWTTYVADGAGIRTLVLESRADHPALDPVNIVDASFPFTAAYPVAHAVAGGRSTRRSARGRRRSPPRSPCRLRVPRPPSWPLGNGSGHATSATGQTESPTASSTTAPSSTPRPRSTRDPCR